MTLSSSMTRSACALTTGLLALAGCSSPSASAQAAVQPTAQPAAQPAAQPDAQAIEASLGDGAPLDAEERFDSVWAYLAEKYDADGDGRVTRAEYGRGQVAFTRLDNNADGAIDGADFDSLEDGVGLMMSQLLLGVYLQDDDDPERLGAAELEQAFGIFDENFDALLTRAEFEARRAERARYGRQLEEGLASQFDDAELYTLLTSGIDTNSDQAIEFDELMAFHARFLASGELPRTYSGGGRAAATLPVATLGALAPDFTLKPYQGDTPVTLSSFRGQKPVALIFGSYTWPPFRESAGRLKELWGEYGEQVEFFVVYIREAHPLDGASPMGGGDGMPIVEDPTSLAERRGVAEVCMTRLALEPMPALIDGLDDAVNTAYSAWPDRLYLIDREGKVAYRGGPGPFGFEPDELEAALRAELGLP